MIDILVRSTSPILSVLVECLIWQKWHCVRPQDKLAAKARDTEQKNDFFAAQNELVVSRKGERQLKEDKRTRGRSDVNRVASTDRASMKIDLKSYLGHSYRFSSWKNESNDRFEMICQADFIQIL